MKKFGSIKALFAAIAASCASLLLMLGLSQAFARAGSSSDKQPSPLSNNSPDAIRKGHRLFLIHCAGCHGVDARGSEEGPDLVGLREGDALIRQVITGGVKKEMPAFQKQLSDTEVQELIAYLRTLKNAK